MSEITIGNSPFHVQAIITNEYGSYNPRYTCSGIHTGVDIVPTVAGGTNNNEYSVCNGQVVRVVNSTTQSLGTQVLIYDTDRNIYWRYCHMVYGSPTVSEGQTITVGMQVGVMGATGNVSGAHLHLEASSQSSWQCGTFYNPCTLLNIPNERGTIINYDGQPVPPPTPPDPPDPPFPTAKKKSRFPWVLYAKKFRNRGNKNG